MKKILVLCDYGEHRSVVMASILRERGHFAVAGSYDNYYDMKKHFDKIKDTTFRPPYFNEIIYMQEGGCDFIGRDDMTDEELKIKCLEKIKELDL